MSKEPDTSPKSSAYHAARGYPFKSVVSKQTHEDARKANQSAESERIARAKAREKRKTMNVKQGT